MTESEIKERVVIKESESSLTSSIVIGEDNKIPPSLPEDREPWRVDFERGDPLDPQNWPQRKKVQASLSLGFAAVVCGCGSSIFSAATEAVSHEFDKNIELSNLGTSLFIAGFASGPIIWGPASESFGRRAPMLLATFGGALFNTIAGASETFAGVVICRFWAGFISAAPVSVSSGAFVDFYLADPYRRGFSLVLFTSSIFVFPILAPIIGALLTQYAGWRWVQYVTGILGFVAVAILYYFQPESYAPVLLARKASRLRKQSGNWGIHSSHELKEFSFATIITTTIVRPLIMLAREPILLLVSIYTAFIYGIFYLNLVAYPIVFHTGYQMSRIVSTLPYIGLAIGMVMGTLLILFVVEPRYKKMAQFKPKHRLIPSMFGGILFSMGIFWFSWTGHYPDKIPWIVPATSGIFTGTGTILILIPCTTFVVDSFVPVAASAIAALACTRSTLGASFVMFACQMFNSMGVAYAGSTIGCISLLFIPVPIIFYKYDEYFKSRSRFALRA